MKCQRAGYKNTTTQARPENKNKKTTKKSEMIYSTSDAMSSERLLDGKHTYSGRADICCTDEAVRRRGIYRDTDSGEGKGTKGEAKKSKKLERRGGD